jgi:hypothetical protein
VKLASDPSCTIISVSPSSVCSNRLFPTINKIYFFFHFKVVDSRRDDATLENFSFDSDIEDLIDKYAELL